MSLTTAAIIHTENKFSSNLGNQSIRMANESQYAGSHFEPGYGGETPLTFAPE